MEQPSFFILGLKRRCSFRLSLEPPSSLLILESPSSLRINPELPISLRPLGGMEGTPIYHLRLCHAPQPRAAELPLSQLGSMRPFHHSLEPPSSHCLSPELLSLLQSATPELFASQPRAAVLPPSQPGATELPHPGASELLPSQPIATEHPSSQPGVVELSPSQPRAIELPSF